MIKIGNFTTFQDEQGKWMYKADNNALTQNKTLKPKYRDLPPYKAIYKIEDLYKKSFDRMLVKAVRNIAHYVKSQSSTTTS